ncbi:MAG: hypothetical protein KatS3mg010_1505 [Acidimicrobiia bacterium]|nr:MAG: hypothetical protein KatS3mg010_1505 [Acidimicrobiia bacterium]
MGLFGLQTKTTAGRVSRTSAVASSTAILKSGARSPATTVVPVRRAMWPCRAYVGSKITADRPGPP